MIDITGLNKGDVLAALYNRATYLGNSVMTYDSNHIMDRSQAEWLLKDQSNFDYIQGRVMKVDLSGDSFDESLYDRDNGAGAALAAVESVRRRS